MTAPTAPGTGPTGDTAIRRLTAAAVLLVAAIAAVVSFLHIEALAVRHGQTVLAAVLLPISIDGTVVAASLAMLRAARAGLPTPRLGRFMLGLAVLATLAANVGYGSAFGIVGALISGWPAVAFIGCAELAINMTRKIGNTHVETAPETATAAPAARPETVPRPTPTRPRGRARSAVTEDDAARVFADELAAGNVPSIRQVKARLSVGTARAQALREHLEAAVRGRVPA